MVCGSKCVWNGVAETIQNLSSCVDCQCSVGAYCVLRRPMADCGCQISTSTPSSLQDSLAHFYVFEVGAPNVPKTVGRIFKSWFLCLDPNFEWFCVWTWIACPKTIAFLRKFDGFCGAHYTETVLVLKSKAQQTPRLYAPNYSPRLHSGYVKIAMENCHL